MKPSPVAAATMVQKVVRGFLVRENVKLVKSVSARVDEIESAIAEAADMVWYNAKDRACVNELLMELLLVLDSARGVREFRKKVIRKVITLQEIVDSISAVADGEESGGDSVIDSAEIEVEGVEETVDSIPEVEERSREDIAMDGESDLGNRGKAEEEEGLAMDCVGETIENEPEIQSWKSDIEDWVLAEAVEKSDLAETLEAPTLRDLLDKMMVENAKLEGRVAELCMSSRKQNSLIERLVERIEQLEMTVQRLGEKTVNS